MPRVTAVIPTFNRPDLLKRAVLSVLAQTMSDLECIVVIDGHDPATLEMLGAIGDKRLRWIAHPEKRGAGQTRDTGANAAESDWVAFLDDDDEWVPTKLEKQLAIAPADGKAIIMSLSQVVMPQGEFVRPSRPYDPEQPLDEWLFGRQSWFKGGEGFLQTSSLMMPRAMFDRLQFSDTRQHEEWELVIRAVKQLGYPLLTVREPLVIHYLGHPRPSLSQTYTWRHSLDWADRMGPLITPGGYSGFCLTTVGRSAANTGEWRAALPLARAAFRKGRPTAKQLLAFALAFALPMRLRRRVRATVQGERALLRPDAA